MTGRQFYDWQTAGGADDVMRMVQIRDLLGGQGWFDLMQYRLGTGEGVLMHWSRFIDLPLVVLIKLFSLLVSPAVAEAMAVIAVGDFDKAAIEAAALANPEVARFSEGRKPKKVVAAFVRTSSKLPP